jgi:hypothetical protein
MKRELPTLDPTFSRAFVKPIADWIHPDVDQMKLYYFRLRNFLYNSDKTKSGYTKLSAGLRLSLYKEFKDVEHFLGLLGVDLTKPYPIA